MDIEPYVSKMLGKNYRILSAMNVPTTTLGVKGGLHQYLKVIKGKTWERELDLQIYFGII